MAATARLNKELMAKYEKQKHTATDPIEQLRAHCLSRGAAGIKGLGRAFRIIDDDGNRSLDMSEFKKGCKDYGLDLSVSDVQSVFNSIDLNGSGSIDFEEFLRAVRPPMNNNRRALIIKAFKKLDKTCDGQVTVADLKGVYNVSRHPKYLSGEWNEDRCLQEFLKCFDSPGDQDGVVTEEEFMNYYSGVSASIDNDAYFDLMMRNAWKI